MVAINVRREDVANLTPECAESMAVRLAEVELKLRHMTEYVQLRRMYLVMVHKASTGGGAESECLS